MTTSDDHEKRKQRSRDWNDAHKEIANQRSREWAEKHPERVREFCSRSNKKRWRTDAQYREKKKEAERIRRAKVRQQVIIQYGGSCYCCGETDLRFLTMDHVNGAGCQHRKELNGVRIEDWARRNNYPPSLRVACYNCNMGARVNNGVCPHQSLVGG